MKFLLELSFPIPSFLLSNRLNNAPECDASMNDTDKQNEEAKKNSNKYGGTKERKEIKLW